MKTFFHKKLHEYPHKYQESKVNCYTAIFNKIKTKIILGQLRKELKFTVSIYRIIYPEKSKKVLEL